MTPRTSCPIPMGASAACLHATAISNASYVWEGGGRCERWSLLGELPCRLVRFCVHHLDDLEGLETRIPALPTTGIVISGRGGSGCARSDAVKSRGKERSPRIGSGSGLYEGGAPTVVPGSSELGEACTMQGVGCGCRGAWAQMDRLRLAVGVGGEDAKATVPPERTFAGGATIGEADKRDDAWPWQQPWSQYKASAGSGSPKCDVRESNGMYLDRGQLLEELKQQSASCCWKWKQGRLSSK
jgi:hypothetical protein